MRLDGSPFRFRGLSFFNALFNPSFNRDDQARRAWLSTFRRNGVTALHAWCQWDFQPPHLFADVGPDKASSSRAVPWPTPLPTGWWRWPMPPPSSAWCWKSPFFPRNVVPTWTADALAEGAVNVARLLVPHRNVLLQIGTSVRRRPNGFTTSIKDADAERLVTSCPGFSDDLGSERHNRLLDVLTPHTVRQPPARFWVDAPRQVGGLVAKLPQTGYR